MSDEERVRQIFARLDAVANPNEIRDIATPQGKATTWFIEQDEFNACPNDGCEFIQRWALAVIYFSTNGDGWFECSGNPLATDPCGTVRPFRGKERFLSSDTECDWAGITCNIEGCVTKIEFGKSFDLGATAPRSIGKSAQLTELFPSYSHRGKQSHRHDCKRNRIAE